MKQNYKTIFGVIALSILSFDSNAQLYSFDTHTFTNAGAVGKDGPTLLQCQTAYAAEVWESDPALFDVTTQGIQEWTVPITGSYSIQANGAQGGDDLYTAAPEVGGLGARMEGTFSLTEGQVLYILVGQRGENTRVTYADNAAAGGGGGSFVWDPLDGSLPLIAAGGGAGGSGYFYANKGGNATTAGSAAQTLANGGADGNGGTSNVGGCSYWAGGGCGWLTNGTGGNIGPNYIYAGSYAQGGRRPLEDGIGGIRYSDGSDEGGDGGFGGGGGGGSDNMGTGGGGGYSGGGGAQGCSSYTGGGGGSYNAGSDPINLAATNSGHGSVIITLLCNPIAVEPFMDVLCYGDGLLLDGTATSGAAVNWDLGVIDAEEFIPGVGSYTYTATTDDVADCAVSVDVLVNELPVVTASVTDDEICLGESVTFSAGGALSYSWFPVDVVSGVPYEVPGTGIFTVIGTDDNGCQNTAEVEVTVHELPIVGAGVDDDEICLGDEIILAGSGALTYSWMPDGVDGVAFAPATAGVLTYMVQGTDEFGCSNSASLTVMVHELPSVEAAVDNSVICSGSDVVFTGSGAVSYTWDLGVVDGESYTPAAEGTETYTVTGTDDNGCENTATVDVEVTPNTLALSATFVMEAFGTDGEIDLTVTGGTPTYSFDWDNDGTGDLDDTEDLTDLVSGTYTVYVIDQEGCEKTVEFILGSQAGVTEIDAAFISIYPNPTNDLLTIKLDGEFSYVIYASNGAVVLNGSAVDNKTISLENLSNGTYFVQINSIGKTKTVKVVKQ